jgi:hypothetical protein
VNGVRRKVFRGPFCLGVTRKTGEAEGNQRDAKDAAKKSDACFGPVATGREKRKELEERKEKASVKEF